MGNRGDWHRDVRVPKCRTSDSERDPQPQLVAHVASIHGMVSFSAGQSPRVSGHPTVSAAFDSTWLALRPRVPTFQCTSSLTLHHISFRPLAFAFLA